MIVKNNLNIRSHHTRASAELWSNINQYANMDTTKVNFIPFMQQILAIFLAKCCKFWSNEYKLNGIKKVAIKNANEFLIHSTLFNHFITYLFPLPFLPTITLCLELNNTTCITIVKNYRWKNSTTSQGGTWNFQSPFDFENFESPI